MVRIYHLNDDKASYTFSDHEATVFKRKGMFAQGAGFAPSGTSSVRIFTEAEINVSEGDYIALSGSDAAEPDKSRCSVIATVTDNRRGANPHWRLTTGGSGNGMFQAQA